ncbi:MFS transporter [Alginatibacterium sediminis]|uniref:MFS transporter n=1 Tax=Alginatibacterium sediminis TaxID=2164068 RepID=A0A420ELJ9_9ALTE|nr:MFS transporter [Alginatibacterium sediminis]RKF21575.1 MFS transporter [Alginatibacterium sediminis]
MPFNVWLLMLCAACAMSAAPLVVFSGGIVGNALAPSSALASLPIASMVVGTAIAVIPVSLLMGVIGRKLAFMLGSGISIAGSLLTAFGINQQNFWWFCAGTFLLGAGLAFVQQYRFAAMESVSPPQMPTAASTVLLGGLIAAVIGPELALRSKDSFETEFVGPFLWLALIYAFCIALLFLFRETKSKKVHQKTEGRALIQIAKQPVFLLAVSSAAIGYAVMSFIMTATPMSMHIHSGHSLEDTKWVIQSHIMAMFIPSFFSGRLISKFGPERVIVAGLIAFAMCILIAVIDRSLLHYWFALILLGVGWNFLFVAGTSLLPQSYQIGEASKAQAANEFIVFGLQALASLSAGWILFSYGWQTLLLVSIPLLLLVLLSLINHSKLLRT